MGFGNPRGIFENRRTVITLDEFIDVPVQPALTFERQEFEMGRGNHPDTENVQNIPGIGWMLRNIPMQPGALVELTDAQPALQTVAGGLLAVAGSVNESKYFAKSGLPGVNYSADVQDSGSYMWQKRVSDAWNVDNALDADQTAFPSPNTVEDTTDMDRVAITTRNHDPRDFVGFRVYIPGTSVNSSGPLWTPMFCGPAGEGGTGRYALKCFGDGRAKLYEAAEDLTWIYRDAFRWVDPGVPIFGALHELWIGSNSVQDASGAFKGTRIKFLTSSFPDVPAKGFGSLLIETQISAAIKAITWGANNPLYSVPGAGETAVTLAPIRVDARRDVRVLAQIALSRFPESGVLVDDVFSIPFLPTGDEEFKIEWYGSVPDGTSMVAKLYNAETGVELADGTITLQDEIGGVATYTPDERVRKLRVRIEFESNTERDKTPVLTSWRIYRSGVFESPAITPVEVNAQGEFPSLVERAPLSVSITGVSRDTSDMSATVQIVDFTGTLTNLATRGMVPIKIETEYAPGDEEEDPPLRTTLFRGYVIQANAEKIAGGTFDGQKHWADKRSRRYTLTCAGEWARLATALAPRGFTWFDQENNRFYKVTTFIRHLLRTAYSNDNINIPDIDIRLFGADSTAQIIEPDSPIAELCAKYARDYLNAYLCQDNYAGDTFQWRLLLEKTAPYTPVARFYVEHPGVFKLPHVDGAYGSHVHPDTEQTVLHTFIRKKTWTTWQEKPEGNVVEVTGGATGDDAPAVGAQSAGRITAIAVNFDSFNALNLDPSDPNYPDGSSPDYLGRYVPIAVRDSTLTTQAAVNWVCRRISDLACHTLNWCSFEAPLILITDLTDPDQVCPRPLRLYDAVEVQNDDGEFETWLVVNCDPGYRKDSIQMGRYTLVSSELIRQVKSAIPLPLSARRNIETFAKTMMGVSGKTNIVATGGKAAIYGGMSPWIALPEKTSDPIQDTDPESETFGQFFFMPDFDPVSDEVLLT